jgi:hypothetical protein
VTRRVTGAAHAMLRTDADGLGRAAGRTRAGRASDSSINGDRHDGQRAPLDASSRRSIVAPR